MRKLFLIPILFSFLFGCAALKQGEWRQATPAEVANQQRIERLEKQLEALNLAIQTGGGRSYSLQELQQMATGTGAAKVRAFDHFEGNDTGAVDKVDTANLTDGDFCFVVYSGGFYVLWYDDDNAEDEDAPNVVYAHDRDAAGAWVLVGSISIKPSTTPAWNFYDSDATAGDINGKIYLNCTDTGDGTEDCDLFFQVQIAGTLTTVIQIDADGSVILSSPLNLGANALTVNSVEVVGADGEVNKAAVEDSGNWDTAYSHSQATTGNPHSVTAADVGAPSVDNTLDAGTGDEQAVNIEYTVNKATSGDDYGLRMNMTDTASPGSSYLLWFGLGDAARFYCYSSGNCWANGSITSTSFKTSGSFYFTDDGDYISNSIDDYFYFRTNDKETFAINLSASNAVTFVSDSDVVSLGIGSWNFLTTGDFGATGSRVNKGWLASLETTNEPTIGGTAVKDVSQTLTNKTIDGDDNTLQDIGYGSIKSTSRSGSDATLITGTKGTSTYVAIWNADGDLVDGPGAPLTPCSTNEIRVAGTCIDSSGWDKNSGDDFNPATPGEIGGTTPAAGNFTTVTASGAIKGTIDTIGTWSAPTTTTPYSPTALALRSSFIYYGATGTINLPDLADGDLGCIYSTGSFTITINPDDAEYIVREGTAQAVGVDMTFTAVAGDYVCFISDGTYVSTLGVKGTLAEGS